MSMKLTDLMKHKGKKIEGRMGGPAPDRFGKGANMVVDKKAQRKLDQEAGLVPFAVKLHADLVKQLQTLALEREVSLNDLTAELLGVGLGNPAGKSAPTKATAKPAAKAEDTAPAKPAKKPAAKK